MKAREGFVSNSSSASFVVKKSDLTDREKEIIFNHLEESKKLHETNKDYDPGNWIDDNDAWRITEDDEFIYGSTNMTNFDMEEFCRFVGINKIDFSY